jgi:predicted small metal-binding protein
MSNEQGNVSTVVIIRAKSGCTLSMEGTEEEVLEAAVKHAVSHHGHARQSGISRRNSRAAQGRLWEPEAYWHMRLTRDNFFSQSSASCWLYCRFHAARRDESSVMRSAPLPQRRNVNRQLPPDHPPIGARRLF